jgi:DNA mismatch repair protein MLH1
LVSTVLAVEEPNRELIPYAAVQDELQVMIVELLNLKAAYLKQWWGIDIRDGAMHTLPLLIAGYCPDLDALPEFLIALAAEVEWTDERARIQDISQVCWSRSTH